MHVTRIFIFNFSFNLEVYFYPLENSFRSTKRREHPYVFVFRSKFVEFCGVDDRVIASAQWRSKALRGPGSTVTWGPSISLPSTSPSLPFPSPFPPLPQPSPFPCREAAPNLARGLGERGKLPQRGLGRSPSRNRI